jgi:prepilin-type N-terminal cleavage/methylation domain-containing protein
MNIAQKGFTLIELLVVIAIIGILSAVVMASLDTARGKASDAAAEEDLNNIMAQAELVYSNNGQSYANVCNTADANGAIVVGAISAAATAEGLVWAGSTNNSANVACIADTTNGAYWLAYTQLPRGVGVGAWWCVDNNGHSKSESASPGLSATVCQ